MLECPSISCRVLGRSWWQLTNPDSCMCGIWKVVLDSINFSLQTWSSHLWSLARLLSNASLMEKDFVLVLLRVAAALSHMCRPRMTRGKAASSVSNVIERRTTTINLRLYIQWTAFASTKNTTHFTAMVGMGHTFLGTNKRKPSIELLSHFRDLSSLLIKTRKVLCWPTQWGTTGKQVLLVSLQIK